MFNLEPKPQTVGLDDEDLDQVNTVRAESHSSQSFLAFASAKTDPPRLPNVSAMHRLVAVAPGVQSVTTKGTGAEILNIPPVTLG